MSFSKFPELFFYIYYMNRVIMKKSFLLIILLFLSIPSFSQMKDEVSKMNLSAKLVLVGEKHQVSNNENLYIDLIEHLEKNNKLKYIILEHSYAGAYIYNQFLETGDTSLICSDFYFNSHSEYRQFWKKLYECNTKLKQKIYVVGLDYDKSYPFVKTLNLIIGNLAKPDKELLRIFEKTDQFLNNLKNPEYPDYPLYLIINSAFNQYFNNKPEAYLRKSFGKYYGDVSLIYLNQHDTDRNSKTNQKWFENLHRIIIEKQLDIGEYSFLGLFGSAHIAANKKSFANICYYNDKSVFKDDVSTILMHYNSIFQGDSLITENQGIEVYKKSLLKTLRKYIDRDFNFTAIEVSALSPKSKKYNKHFKYVFLMKNQRQLEMSKLICR